MMRRLRIARINWHTTDTENGMPVHRAFDVMAPIDVHSARCLAIQTGRAASSPPRAGRNFFGPCKRSIYWAFAISKCRYRAERLANRASQGVENPWNLIAICSGSRRLGLSHTGPENKASPACLTRCEQSLRDWHPTPACPRPKDSGQRSILKLIDKLTCTHWKAPPLHGAHPERT